MKKRIESDKRKRTAIIKLFTSATLSTAFISFITTQQGLQSYIFENNIIFAFVLSGSVQGSLFALSTEVNNIRIRLSKLAKALVFIIWLLLFLFSSGFSYVSICSTAYPSSVLQKDAEQVLSEYCLTTDYELYDYIQMLEKDYLESIQEYLNLVNGVSNSSEGYAIGTDDYMIFSQEIRQLEAYMADSEIDEFREIKEILDSEILIISIKRLQSGNFSPNDYNAYVGSEDATGHLPAKIDKTSKKRDVYFKKYQNQVQEINELDERLKTFHDLQNKFYIKNSKARDMAVKLRDKYKSIYDKLDDFVNDLNIFYSFVTVDFKGGTESELHEKTKQLTKLSQKEEIDSDGVLAIAEDVYSLLVDNNTSSSEPSMSRYPEFKSSIRGYKVVLEQKAKIEKEINELNDYNTGLLLHNYSTNGTKEDTSQEFDNTSSQEWKIAWNQHLNMIESIIENLQDSNHQDSIDNSEQGTLNLPRLPHAKKDYIRAINRRRRLYLEEISSFERNWTLLKESIPFIGFHPYGLMMLTSLVIAFGLDMFSMGIGYILYNYIKNTNNIQKQDEASQ